MEKMNVLTFARTGHVLGAVTRRSRADSPVAVDDVAPSGVLLRDDDGAGLRTSIAAGELRIESVPLDVRAWYRPRLYAVVAGQIEEQLAASALTVDIDGSTGEAVVSAPAPSSDLTVTLHVAGVALGLSLILSVTIASGTTEGEAPLVLPAGDYQVMVFAPGFAADLRKVTVAVS